MGLEPTIFCSVGRRVIHYATRLIVPTSTLSTFLNTLITLLYNLSLEHISVPHNEHSNERLAVK